MVAIRTELTKVKWHRDLTGLMLSVHSSLPLPIACGYFILSCLCFRQLGASVEEGPDYCIITPPEKLNVAAIDTYDDHRMAMAFSLAACAEVPVTIRDPGCTRKTFPDYFDVLSTFVKN